MRWRRARVLTLASCAGSLLGGTPPGGDALPVDCGGAEFNLSDDRRLSAPIDTSVPQEDLRRTLASRGSIQLVNCKVVTGKPGENVARFVVADNLILRDTRIVTYDNQLLIVASRLVASGSVIESFPRSGTQSAFPPEAPPGAKGVDGLPGPKVTVRILSSIEGMLTVDVSGQAGGNGGVGSMGTRGPVGARGRDSVPGLFDCRSGAGDGERGGQGGTGGDGGKGGKGGDGGTLVLEGIANSRINLFPCKSAGGAPGMGGAAGAGGPGGAGGDGGSGGGFCRGGSPGPPGRPGEPGQPGGEGNGGSPGACPQQAASDP